VEAKVREAALEDRLILTGARSDVPQILAALDIFVMTSDTEGLPNAVMEAMASGLPVVATRVGGTPELVAEGETGHLVPPGRREPLLEALRALVADRALRRRMGEAGRIRIAAEFTLQRMVAGTRAVYDSLFDARA
jgi:glycosyltransferase involved in cell wall biosynthesis